MSGLNLFDGFSFVDHDLKSNLAKIIHQDVLLDNKSDFRRDAEKIKPVVLSDEETFDSSESSVNKSSSLVESDTVSTDNALILEMDAVSSLFVNFITDHYFSVIDETNLIKFIKLIDEDTVSSIFSWLEVCQKFIHEVTIVLVNPCVVNICWFTKFIFFTWSQQSIWSFLQPKEIWKLRKELVKQEPWNEFILNLRW